MRPDPLRDALGRFRAPTPAERLGFVSPAPPEPAPPAPVPPVPVIPAGPMGGARHGGDFVRERLRGLYPHNPYL